MLAIILFLVLLIMGAVSIGFLTFVVLPKSFKLMRIRLKKADKLIQEYEEERRTHKRTMNKKSYAEPKWYPTGWVFNEETQLWEPPDYIEKEAEQKWKWDEEKKIWVDKEKLFRQERYQKFREGKEPTFDEWKAQRDKQDP